MGWIVLGLVWFGSGDAAGLVGFRWELILALGGSELVGKVGRV